MTSQPEAWGRAAAVYERAFVDPYQDAERGPLLTALEVIPDRASLTVADLGCGIGPLLPTLAAHFGRVVGIDFAAGMLDRAHERCAGLKNVELEQRDLKDLSAWHGKFDVAVAVNSLVQPDVGDLETVLKQVRACVKPGGHFLGVVPAIDAVHYHTMLLLDRARRAGMPAAQARANAAQHGEHNLYDFAFGDFRYLGLEQHFWQPFEVSYRLRRAGFRHVRRAKLRLSWSQVACGADLKRYPPPWDWFFSAR